MIKNHPNAKDLATTTTSSITDKSSNGARWAKDGVNLKWLTKNVDGYSKVHIILEHFTLAEVKPHLAYSLKVPISQLPSGLDLLVFELSGGSPFWIEEIASFIEASGLDEFMKSLDDDGDDQHGKVNGGESESKARLVALRRMNSVSTQHRVRCCFCK